MALFQLVLALCLAGLAVLSIAGFFSRFSHWLDICDHFRMQYLALLICLAAVGLLGAQWVLIGLAGAFALLNLVIIFPIWMRPTGWKRGPTGYRLLMANVLRKNKAYPQLLEIIKSSQPDLIGLVEPDQDWLDGLAVLSEAYPYRHTAIRGDNYGLALFSRRPLHDLEVHTLTAKGVPTLTAQTELDGTALTIILTHPPPPKNTPDLFLRDRQMECLVDLANRYPGEKILCGDFNITPWSAVFRRMAHRSALRDSTRGFGYQPTWPVERWWLRVPIDHCLVSEGIRIVRRHIGPQFDSDHLPLIVDFSFE
jgi:endonuclease/exonuclease/phosphatase (EEP) superfamily protein YafD